MFSVARRHRRAAAAREQFEDGIRSAPMARAAELLDAEPSPRFVLVDPGDRVVRRPSACDGSAAPRACAPPTSRTSTRRSAGSAPSPKASGSMPQKLASAARRPRACAASTIVAHHALRHRDVVERRRVGAERSHRGVRPLVNADVIEVPVQPVFAERDHGVRAEAPHARRRSRRAARARRAQRRSPSG